MIDQERRDIEGVNKPLIVKQINHHKDTNGLFLGVFVDEDDFAPHGTTLELASVCELLRICSEFIQENTK